MKETFFPDFWCNFVFDFPEYASVPSTNLAEVMQKSNGSTKPAISIAPQQPLSMMRQSFNIEDANIPIPEELLEIYKSYRPTPLKKANKFKQAHSLKSDIYYKYEGGNISGSHKLNTAFAQAYYYKKAGAKHLISGTGAGQWGTALAYACNAFGLKCTIFMVGISARQKSQRLEMMRCFGGRVFESPSNETVVGRRALNDDANHPGTLAIATGEALELARAIEGGHFAVGSGENCVLLHQTLIGIEAERQLSAINVFPDAVVACMGAGSNFAGISMPILRQARLLGKPIRLVAAEPLSCPKMTRGAYVYDINDFSGTTPLTKMYTLGSDFVAPPIYAGGLRYHGTSPFLSAMHANKHSEAVAIGEEEALQAGLSFSKNEGILPAPESAHAIAAALRLANEPDRSRPKTILINISGHGLFDVEAYGSLNRGTLEPDLDEADLDASLTKCKAFSRIVEKAMTRTDSGN